MDNLHRFKSLDVFRGFTVALMVMVNSPGNQMPYPCLTHATWNGCTFADVVFPFFLWIVGACTLFSLTAQQRKYGKSRAQLYAFIMKRTIWLFLIGLFLNAIPFDGLDSIRIMGVLQRIALCYFFAAIFCLHSNLKTLCGMIIIILGSYWYILTQYPGFDSLSPNDMTRNIIAHLDRIMMGSHHLYTPLFDPEGVLSTWPAIATTLLGLILPYILLSPSSPQKKLGMMITTGLTLSALGFIWQFTLPMNKSLWTSSYVLWTSGLAFLGYAYCYWAIEIRGLAYKPLYILGIHALFIYVLHVVLLKLQALIRIPLTDHTTISLKTWITKTCFTTQSAAFNSLLYTLSFFLLCYGITLLKHYRLHAIK